MHAHERHVAHSAAEPHAIVAVPPGSPGATFSQCVLPAAQVWSPQWVGGLDHGMGGSPSQAFPSLTGMQHGVFGPSPLAGGQLRPSSRYVPVAHWPPPLERHVPPACAQRSSVVAPSVDVVASFARASEAVPPSAPVCVVVTPPSSIVPAPPPPHAIARTSAATATSRKWSLAQLRARLMGPDSSKSSTERWLHGFREPRRGRMRDHRDPLAVRGTRWHSARGCKDARTCHGTGRHMIRFASRSASERADSLESGVATSMREPRSK